MTDKKKDSKARKTIEFLTGWINPYSKTQRRGAVILALAIAAGEYCYIRHGAAENKRKKKEEGRS
jgi:hypothetical protein